MRKTGESSSSRPTRRQVTTPRRHRPDRRLWGLVEGGPSGCAPKGHLFWRRRDGVPLISFVRSFERVGPRAV